MNNSKSQYYAYSPDWALDDKSISKEIVKQHNGKSREIYYFDVTKNKNTPINTSRPEFGNDLYLHEHKIIKLKTSTNFLCDIVLRVHYNSYVTKNKERKRCFDVIPFRYEDTFYAKQFRWHLGQSLFVDTLALKEFAQLYNTTPAIVKRIYTDSEMRNKMRETPLEDVKRIVIYEYHFESEKQDCTIFFDLDSGLLIYAQRGQSGSQVKAFFEKFRETLMPNITKIYVSENNVSYNDAIKEEYPDMEVSHNFEEAKEIFIENQLKEIAVHA